MNFSFYTPCPMPSPCLITTPQSPMVRVMIDEGGSRQIQILSFSPINIFKTTQVLCHGGGSISEGKRCYSINDYCVHTMDQALWETL